MWCHWKAKQRSAEMSRLVEAMPHAPSTSSSALVLDFLTTLSIFFRLCWAEVANLPALEVDLAIAGAARAPEAPAGRLVKGIFKASIRVFFTNIW
jgi:hypothetical protein